MSFEVVQNRSESTGIGIGRSQQEPSHAMCLRSDNYFVVFYSFTLCVHFVYRPLFRRPNPADSGQLRLQPIPDDSGQSSSTPTTPNDSERLWTTPDDSDLQRLRAIPDDFDSKRFRAISDESELRRCAHNAGHLLTYRIEQQSVCKFPPNFIEQVNILLNLTDNQ